MAGSSSDRLRQTLYGYQIFFIIISAVIGGGVFDNNGTALELSGPWGFILSIFVMTIIALAVSESVGELTQQFPIYNAIVEYVRAFVDEDLGWVIGVAYWYAYAASFAAQNLAAASLSQYWGLPTLWQILAFYVLAPLVYFGLNMMGVFYYGVVETVGGFLKICYLLGVTVFFYIIAGQDHRGGSKAPISDGIENNTNFADDHATAVCYAIPLVAYSFQGIEIVAMTAFEARDASSLRWASRWTTYVVVLLYIMCTIGEALNVSWADNHLPYIYGGIANSTTPTAVFNPRSTSMVVNVAWAAQHHITAALFNGCLIFSVLSAGNTSLYASSRTLYGLTRKLPKTNWLTRQLGALGEVNSRTGVPVAALAVSAVAFCWVPFLQLITGYALQDLIEIMSVSASTACLIVWASLCLAFIRYHRWLRLCDTDLARHHPDFRRQSLNYTARTNLESMQPVIAWVGLIGCITIFAFSSATWWDTKATFTKVATAYAAHIVLFTLFILVKLFSGRLFKPWGVRLDSDSTELIEVLKGLKEKKIDKHPSKTKARLRQLWDRGTEREEVAVTEAECQREEVEVDEEEGISFGNEFQVVVNRSVGVEEHGPSSVDEREEVIPK